MRALIPFAIVLGVSIGGLSPSIAWAQQAPSRDQVRALLTGFESVPSDAEWQRLGDGALPHLIALYDDPAQPAYVRLRAVGAAGAFPTSATRTFLLAVARAVEQSDLLAREAVRALGRGFGPRAQVELAAFLSHDSPLVREVAARALGRAQVGSPALRGRLDVERDPEVRNAIQHALAR